MQPVSKASCMAPDHVNQTPGYYDDPIADGVSKGRGDLDGGDMSHHHRFQRVQRRAAIMTDLLVAALACD